MNHKTKKEIVLYYLNNLLKHPLYGKLEDHVCDWFEDESKELTGNDIGEQWESRRFRAKDDSKMPRNYQTMRKLFEGRKSRLIETPEITAIIKAFDLSPQYHDIVALWVHGANIPMLSRLTVEHCSDYQQQMMAEMIGLTLNQYDRLYAPSGELIGKGLCETGSRRDFNHKMTETFKNILLSHCKTPEAVKRIVLGTPLKATLRPEHFEHLQTEYDWIKNLLSNALKKKQRGVNILIYGKPGTGKTEIVKTLCNEIGVPLYAVSENQSEEHNGTGRREDLTAACCLLKSDHRSVLLMDEAEDVFGATSSFNFFGFASEDRSSKKSKLFFNKLLENNPVPVIWVSNSIGGVDPAHLRRFAYALNMEAPDDTVQAKIWNYSAKKHKVKLPEKKIETLVKHYDIAPAIIDASLRTAALTNDHAAIEKTIESLQTAMFGRVSKKANVSEQKFSTALLNTDLDLEKLAQRILSLKGESFSLCLYGIPGSGKSAYARYLAEKLKMKVLHQRASDLISCWVGASEKNIAEAFAEAKRKKMLLVLDEADSFLQDRRNARQSWEVTQVNEMLTQMESHPLPFVCTTNLIDDLDQASLRRFTFKVKYDYLTRPQVSMAFKHFFGTESTVPLIGLNCLSPGDFVVVAKKAKICGIADHKELVSMLRQEQEIKDAKGNPIGFTAL